MLGPENVEEDIIQNDNQVDEKKEEPKKHSKVPIEGSGSLDLNLYKSPKTWKKSITRFFRNQIRSTKSNDGEAAAGSSTALDGAELSPEQKWQSLGKMFRRPSTQHADGKAAPPPGAPAHPAPAADYPHKKTLAIKKVLSSYFGKNSKALPPTDEKQ